MTVRGFLVLVAGLACGCGGGASDPAVVRVGVHEVSFSVPDGWQHYDHGREQRLESSEGDIVITDLGPVAADGFIRVVVDAREVCRGGRREDAKHLLRGLQPWRGIDDEQTRREISDDLDPVFRDRPEAEVEHAFDAVLSRLDNLPPPDLSSIADEVLNDLNHDSRRDVERREKLRVDGRDARRIVTWQRLTHDHRRHHVFTINQGNLLVLRMDVGVEAILEPAFATVVRSMTFVGPDSH